MANKNKSVAHKKHISDPFVTNKYVFFDKSWLSQSYKKSMTIKSIKYNCCQQYMMAEKARLFNDKKCLDKIMSSNHPSHYHKIGRQINGFNQQIWDEHKSEIIYNANYAKFIQNDDLKEQLLSFGNRIFVKAAKHNKIYGIGLTITDSNINNKNEWNGQNILGNVITKIRDEIYCKANTITGIFPNDRDYKQFYAIYEALSSLKNLSNCNFILIEIAEYATGHIKRCCNRHCGNDVFILNQHLKQKYNKYLDSILNTEYYYEPTENLIYCVVCSKHIKTNQCAALIVWDSFWNRRNCNGKYIMNPYIKNKDIDASVCSCGRKRICSAHQCCKTCKARFCDETIFANNEMTGYCRQRTECTKCDGKCCVKCCKSPKSFGW